MMHLTEEGKEKMKSPVLWALLVAIILQAGNSFVISNLSGSVEKANKSAERSEQTARKAEAASNRATKALEDAIKASTDSGQAEQTGKAIAVIFTLKDLVCEDHPGDERCKDG